MWPPSPEPESLRGVDEAKVSRSNHPCGGPARLQAPYSGAVQGLLPSAAPAAPFLTQAPHGLPLTEFFEL